MQRYKIWSAELAVQTKFTSGIIIA